MRALAMEFYKCRRRKIGLICLVFVAAQLVWTGVSLNHMAPAEMAGGWQAMLYSLALIDAVMLPLTVAAIASRNCELEHKGSTLKLLETMTAPGTLYATKLAWGFLVLAGMLLLRAALMVALGLEMGCPGQVPYGRFLLHFLFSLLVSFGIYALQQGLSLGLANQAAPLAVGIFGSFVGLFSLFFPLWVQRLVPWGHYGVLIQAGMLWDEATRVSTYFWVDTPLWELLFPLAWLAAAAAIGGRIFVKKEV